MISAGKNVFRELVEYPPLLRAKIGKKDPPQKSKHIKTIYSCLPNASFFYQKRYLLPITTITKQYNRWKVQVCKSYNQQSRISIIISATTFKVRKMFFVCLGIIRVSDLCFRVVESSNGRRLIDQKEFFSNGRCYQTKMARINWTRRAPRVSSTGPNDGTFDQTSAFDTFYWRHNNPRIVNKSSIASTRLLSTWCHTIGSVQLGLSRAPPSTQKAFLDEKLR